MKSNKIYCLDSSAVFDAWMVLYKPNVFPGLYEELATKLQSQGCLIDAIYDEIFKDTNKWKQMTATEQANYPLRNWISNVAQLPRIDSSSVDGLHDELESKYAPRPTINSGVSSNDLRLIAYAKTNDMVVVTSEKHQKSKPKFLSGYRIPAVCEEESVTCLTLIKMFENLNIKI